MANPLILVVDGNADELELTRRAVDRRFGADYEVVASRSCRAALELLRARATTHNPVALVLADLSMADMSGIELLSDVTAIAHGAKRLLTVTGASSTRRANRSCAQPRAVTLTVSRPSRGAMPTSPSTARCPRTSNNGITCTAHSLRRSR